MPIFNGKTCNINGPDIGGEVHIRADTAHKVFDEVRVNIQDLIDFLRKQGYEIKNPPSKIYNDFKDWIKATWTGIRTTEEVKGTLTAIAPKKMRQFRFDSYKDHALLAIWDSASNPLFNAKVYTLQDIIRIFELTESL